MSLAAMRNHEKRANQAYAEAKTMLDALDESNSDMTDEKSAEIDAHLDVYAAEMKKANIIKKAADIEKEINTPTRTHPFSSDEKATLDGGKEMSEEEVAYVKAFDTYMHTRELQIEQSEIKTLSSHTDPDGGYIVLDDFRAQLIQKIRDRVFIRQRATVISTSAASISFPAFDYDATVSDVAENEQIPEENLTNLFGKENFVPHKHGRIFRVPQELLEDAEFDVVNLLTSHFATRFAEVEEQQLLTGNGITQALGLLNAGLPTTDFETSGSNLVTADDIVGIPYEMRAVYRAQGVYMMHRNFVKQVRKLKEGALTPSDDSPAFTVGAYLWQPALRAGEPATLNGFPLVESEWMPDGTSTTTADPYIFFGDLSNYWIIDRKGMAIKRLDEKYAEFDQIGFRLRKRFDGAPILRDPFQIMVRAA